MDPSSLSEVAPVGDSPLFLHTEVPANDAAPFLISPATDCAVVELACDVERPTEQLERVHTNLALERAFDIVLATVLILALLPLLVACAIAVRCSGPGPLLFRHERIGRDGKRFLCLKFRTMTHMAQDSLEEILCRSSESSEEWGACHKLRKDPRTTPIGRFLRRYSLDELPQLGNVLVGDMSVVGPRPIVAAEVPRYGISYAAYCSVKPGLTGLWQVSGRHALTYEERVQLDTRYARSKSVGGDLLILLKTVPVVLFGQNE